MQNPIHTASVRYSLPTRYETARNPACDRQTDPFSVLDASPPSGEPGWSSDGTGRGGRNDQHGVFGNGVTSFTLVYLRLCVCMYICMYVCM